MGIDSMKRRSLGAVAVLAAVAALVWLCVPLLAGRIVGFNPALPAGSYCRVPIEKVHPTQFAVGYWEVEQRAATIARLSPKKLEVYLREHMAWLVIGPGGEPYLIDGHHLCMAMLKSGKGKTVEALVVANWRSLPVAEFWAKMKENKRVYLYDNRGRGPLEVEQLPKKVTELTDDPYRSLAWAVRDRGGYQKTTVSFSEFQWANYFRKRIEIGPRPKDFEKAVKEALKICHSAEAKNLPGYRP